MEKISCYMLFHRDFFWSYRSLFFNKFLKHRLHEATKLNMVIQRSNKWVFKRIQASQEYFLEKRGFGESDKFLKKLPSFSLPKSKSSVYHPLPLSNTCRKVLNLNYRTLFWRSKTFLKLVRENYLKLIIVT